MLDTGLSPLASLEVLTTTSTVSKAYSHTDHLGTPKVLADEDQAVAPFGKAQIETELLRLLPLYFALKMLHAARKWLKYVKGCHPVQLEEKL